MDRSAGRTEVARLRHALLAAVLGGALAFLALPGTVWAQQDSSDFQYDSPSAAEGPMSGDPVEVEGSTGGTFESGSVLLIAGSFSVAPGASVTLEDADGTRATMIEGEGASVVQRGQELAVSGAPARVSGGDERLGTEGLRVSSSTGVAAEGVAPPEEEWGSVGIAALPATGGPLLLALLGAVAAVGAGLAIRRYSRSE